MPLSIFAPPSTDWLTESRRRLGTTRASYSNAINDTRRDALGLARATAGVGSGAAASRAAMQAAAPAIADLRTAEVGAMEATRARIAAEQMAERERQQDFMNNLFGGLAGVAGQMMVPLIGGLGSGGRPAESPGGMSAPPPVASAAPASLMAAGRNPATPAHIGTMPRDPSTAAAMPGASVPADPGPIPADMAALEEERRRRAGLAGLFGTAATAAGAANPLAGLGVGLAGRLFG